MRMRPHVQPAPGQELARPHLVEEDERPDHLPLPRRQGAAHLEAAEVVGARQEHQLHAAGRGRAFGIFGRLPAHGLCSPRFRKTVPDGIAAGARRAIQ